MTIAWLTRHAETVTPHLFHGAESDEILGELGERQAIAAAEHFAELQPTIVVSSAMRRAIATAAPIAARCAVPHRIVPELHERRVGILCRTVHSQIDGPWAETLRAWQRGDVHFTTEGAESFAELAARIVLAWNTLMDSLRGERVVVVSHGITCKILLLSILPGWGPTRWNELGRASNLATSELIFRDGAWHPEMLLQVPPKVAALPLLPRPDASTA
ncbi:MAG: histidine phosphatase family protein [Gemmataceae bacterium]